MDCCNCEGCESVFDEQAAASKLKSYREKGPARETRLLLRILKEQGIDNLTLLDIGGGVGVIQYELLDAGVSTVVSADASRAYISAAQQEAERRGQAGRITHQHGDFVELAAGIEDADIVTLDRVICCYRNMEALVELSAVRARRFYGLVYPRSKWWTKAMIWAENFQRQVRRRPFRAFVHSTAAVEAVLGDNGLQKLAHHKTLFWQVVVYVRPQ